MLTLTAASEQIRGRRLSPVELTRSCLDRIDRLNPASERIHYGHL